MKISLKKSKNTIENEYYKQTPSIQTEQDNKPISLSE